VAARTQPSRADGPAGASRGRNSAGLSLEPSWRGFVPARGRASAVALNKTYRSRFTRRRNHARVPKVTGERRRASAPPANGTRPRRAVVTQVHDCLVFAQPIPSLHSVFLFPAPEARGCPCVFRGLRGHQPSYAVHNSERTTLYCAPMQRDRCARPRPLSARSSKPPGCRGYAYTDSHDRPHQLTGWKQPRVLRAHVAEVVPPELHLDMFARTASVLLSDQDDPLRVPASSIRLLVNHMKRGEPLHLRANLPAQDVAALMSSWTAFTRTHSCQYVFRGGGASGNLRRLWDSKEESLSLEVGIPPQADQPHRNCLLPNPVLEWLHESRDEEGIESRVLRLHERMAALLTAVSGSAADIACPTFLTGAVWDSGGPLHFDEYNNMCLLTHGRKFVLHAPPSAVLLRPLDDLGVPAAVCGAANERRDIHPLRPGGTPYCEPPPGSFELTELLPGDILFLPSGRWHWVRSDPFTVMTNVWCAPSTEAD
jgi:hypothetical protein